MPWGLAGTARLCRIPGLNQSEVIEVSQWILGTTKRPEEHRLQVFGQEHLVLAYKKQDGALGRVQKRLLPNLPSWMVAMPPTQKSEAPPPQTNSGVWAHVHQTASTD
jgi:hypothetical protein